MKQNCLFIIVNNWELVEKTAMQLSASQKLPAMLSDKGSKTGNYMKMLAMSECELSG